MHLTSLVPKRTYLSVQIFYKPLKMLIYFQFYLKGRKTEIDLPICWVTHKIPTTNRPKFGTWNSIWSHACSREPRMDYKLIMNRTLCQKQRGWDSNQVQQFGMHVSQQLLQMLPSPWLFWKSSPLVMEAVWVRGGCTYIRSCWKKNKEIPFTISFKNQIFRKI